MGNTNIFVRARRWAKFLYQYIGERMHGLDFSMLYVGELQRNVAAFHGYSMTDADDMKRMLKELPIDPSQSAFVDLGCGKGMCMKCAVECGFKKVAGVDLDPHLLEIARNNMKKLNMDVDCIYSNVLDFDHYADYDVFYLFNPFGKQITEQVALKIIESQQERNRDIWIVYYHAKFAEAFDNTGYIFQKETHDQMRDWTTRYYLYPKK